MTRLAVIGLGLIGGSVARALASRAPGRWQIAAWSRSASVLDAALADGSIAEAARTPEAAARGADLVILAAPPAVNRGLVASVGPVVAADGGVLSDVTSVQVPMAEAARTVPGLRFVGGHPMSGRERSGYAAATADLFVGRPWIVLPGEGSREADAALVEAVAVACGAWTVRMDAAVHDRIVASISHLPLVVSAALAEAVVGSPDWEVAAKLAGGGFRDTTRVARGDPALGAGIAALNAREIVAWLDRFSWILAAWRRALAPTGTDPDAVEPEAPELAALEGRFAAIRDALERGMPLATSGAAAPGSAASTTPGDGRASGWRDHPAGTGTVPGSDRVPDAGRS